MSVLFPWFMENKSERGTNKSLREPLRGSRDLFIPNSDSSFPINQEKKHTRSLRIWVQMCCLGRLYHTHSCTEQSVCKSDPLTDCHF